MPTSMPKTETEVNPSEIIENEALAASEPKDVQPAAETADCSENQSASIGNDSSQPVIQYKEVDIYQKKLLVLPKISFTINPGEFVYLIGKTGSGKSSILKSLIAEIKPQGEEATVIGYDLVHMKTKHIPDLRKKIGMVFQDYQLLNDKTVIENLMFVLRATRWKDKTAMLNRCEEVLSLVGLATKDFKLPSQLSGGEQQRVCIARALLNSPDLILADEPTGNLDPISSEEIFQVFHNINKSGTTILMATHNFSMIDKFPSRTICVEDGKLIDSMV